MGDAISAVKQELESLLSSSALSLDSIEGIILILILLCLVHFLWKKVYGAVIWCCLGVMLFQIMYCLGQTGFNDIVPLSTIFKYDIMTAIAQCFVGTKISSALLWMDAFLTVSCQNLWNIGCDFFNSIIRIGSGLFTNVSDTMGI